MHCALRVLPKVGLLELRKLTFGAWGVRALRSHSNQFEFRDKLFYREVKSARAFSRAYLAWEAFNCLQIRFKLCKPSQGSAKYPKCPPSHPHTPEQRGGVAAWHRRLSASGVKCKCPPRFSSRFLAQISTSPPPWVGLGWALRAQFPYRSAFGYSGCLSVK